MLLRPWEQQIRIDGTWCVASGVAAVPPAAGCERRVGDTRKPKLRALPQLLHLPGQQTTFQTSAVDDKEHRVSSWPNLEQPKPPRSRTARNARVGLTKHRGRERTPPT